MTKVDVPLRRRKGKIIPTVGIWLQLENSTVRDAGVGASTERIRSDTFRFESSGADEMDCL